MTNREKFKETFGFNPYTKNCIVPNSVCVTIIGDCDDCPFGGWWDKEYKSCFQMREDIDDGK